ncbi:hypothetical protein EDD21DRAFT_37634 [Dissophora ornata]|nr:hypothetical protein EDD21DRAFT_37634 [Dissophora ornata]
MHAIKYKIRTKKKKIRCSKQVRFYGFSSIGITPLFMRARRRGCMRVVCICVCVFVCVYKMGKGKIRNIKSCSIRPGGFVKSPFQGIH